jgi:hypothetical protein
MPIAAKPIPKVSSLPAPKRTAERPAIVEPTMIAIVIGRKARPASIGV